MILDEDELIISVFRAFKFCNEHGSYMYIDVIKDAVVETYRLDHPSNLLRLVWCTLSICHKKEEVENVYDAR